MGSKVPIAQRGTKKPEVANGAAEFALKVKIDFKPHHKGITGEGAGKCYR